MATKRGLNILITGGSRGIGAATARLLAATISNSTIHIVGRDREALRNVTRSISKGDVSQHSYICGNISRPNFWDSVPFQDPHNDEVATSRTSNRKSGEEPTPTVWSLGDNTLKNLPIPDILVNCAGVTGHKFLIQQSEEEISDIISTNLLGTTYACRRVGKLMVKKARRKTKRIGNQNHENDKHSEPRTFETAEGQPVKQQQGGMVELEPEGSNLSNITTGAFPREHAPYSHSIAPIFPGPCIINIASLLGRNGGVGNVAYAASKAGVLALTRALAAELGPWGVRVNAVSPGFIETDMTSSIAEDTRVKLTKRIPLERFGTADEVADAVRYLIYSSYANNCVLSIDGGLSTRGPI